VVAETGEVGVQCRDQISEEWPGYGGGHRPTMPTSSYKEMPRNGWASGGAHGKAWSQSQGRRGILASRPAETEQ